MVNGLTDAFWDTLLSNIGNEKCTPFLGAGVSFGTLELGGEVATRWADQHHYPLSDRTDLARVAQYVAIKQGDPVYPKDQVAHDFVGKGPPDFADPKEPHRVLADLPIPVFITTNYDDFMVRALQHVGRQPTREYSRWNTDPAFEEQETAFDRPEGFEPTVDNPLVFHLHGALDKPESMVLTEDDYIDFLVNIDSVPERIRRAMAHTSLLFVGYSLRDWDFRVLYRGLVHRVPPSRKRLTVAVQFDESDDKQLADPAAIRAYLDRYFEWMDVSVFWGSAADFAGELRERWDAHIDAG